MPNIQKMKSTKRKRHARSSRFNRRMPKAKKHQHGYERTWMAEK